jgi:1,4-dihydroxy-2-naphthoate octaprenyltransferase
MIPLTLLFIIIIGLLWLVVQLLQNFFDTYSNLDEDCYANDWKNIREKQSNMVYLEKTNKEVSCTISKRLVELQKLPALQTQEEKPEILIITLKQLLQSSLNLLK